MRHIFLALIFIAQMAVASSVAEGYPQCERVKRSINSGWRFHLGDAESKFFTTSHLDKAWEEVTIPHTLELTDLSLNGYTDDKSQPTFMRNVGWYRKSLFIPKSDRRVYLEFEGVHQVTTLWVNGRKVGVHSVGGYTPFNFDITDFVKRGATNQITIMADNRVNPVVPPDPGPFDYIKFGGLYRDIYLVEKSPVHITSNLDSTFSGVTITTPSVDYINGNATIDIRTEVHNSSRRESGVRLEQRVVDREGRVVLRLNEEATISAGEKYRFAQIGGIDEAVQFWDLENPYLYKVNTTLYSADGEVLDVVDNRLGLRKVEFDHESGFRLNGKNIELIGFNRHQHYPFIGDALPNSLHYRDMVQFKEMGLNIMRTAHYPQDDEIIKACDELGILVYEEAPTWVSISEEREWMENEMSAMRAMIRNHKNSPSVIIWGAGVNHRGAVAELQFVAKQEDPTRLTASQSSRWTGWQTSSWSDIFANMNYGAGIWGREEPLFGMEGWYGAEALAPYLRDPMMPGMISWTAHAYYTFHVFEGLDDGMEVRTRLGIMDAFRYPKEDDYFWYPAEFGTEPYMHIKDDWCEGLQMLTIYSNASEVEIFVNGASRGRYRPSRSLKYDGLSHPPFEIEGLRYEAGELRVVGYRNSREIVENTTHTPTEATQIRLTAADYGVEMFADGNDIMVLHAEVLDRNGVRIRDYEGEVKFIVKSGDGSIVGDNIGKGYNPMAVRNGVASALVRSGFKAGEIEVIAESQGLTSGEVTFATIEYQEDRVAAESYPIIDSESIAVDMGGEGQLTQFGWSAWNSAEAHSASATIRPATLGNYVAGAIPATCDRSEIEATDGEVLDGCVTFTIGCDTEDGVLRWLGEMNVIGRNNFVYGDGLLAIDKGGVTLKIEGLAKGKYELRSYHHAPKSNTNDMDPNLERLRSESIHKLPYAKAISIDVNGEVKSRGVRPTSGKDQQYSDPTIATTPFKVAANGETINIRFKSEDEVAGVWFNGFILTKFK